MKTLSPVFFALYCTFATLLTGNAFAQPITLAQWQTELIAPWIVTLEGDERLRTLKISAATPRPDGSLLLDATYGWTVGGKQEAIKASASQSDGQSSMQFVTPADGKAVVTLKSGEGFEGTYSLKDSTKTITMRRVTEEELKLKEAAISAAAKTVLSMKAPSLFSSKDETNAFWLRRLNAANQMLDVGAAIEALPQVADSENDLVKRLKVYEDTARIFLRVNNVNDQLRILELILGDDKLMPGARALIATSLARSWSLSNDTFRASRILNTAKNLASKTSKDESSSLVQSIPLEIASTELAILSRSGQVIKAATQSVVVDSIYWNLYLNAVTSDAKASTLGKWANNSWDHVNNSIRVNRAAQALIFAQEVNRVIEDKKIEWFYRSIAKAALGSALAANGLYGQALEATELAIKICESSRALLTDNNCNLARLKRAQILIVLNRAEESGPDISHILQARSQSQVIVGNFSEEELMMLAAMARGDWVAAQASATKSFDSNFRYWGSEHAWTKHSAAALMLTRLRDPAYVLNKVTAERFLSTYLFTAAANGDSGQRGTVYDMIAIEEVLKRIIEGNGKLGADDASDLAFAVSEYLRSGVSQTALYDGAAKLAATSPDLRALIDKEQALRATLGSRRSNAARAYSQTERMTSQNADELIIKRQQDALNEAQKLLAIEDEGLQELRREIARRFPVYQELVNPRIPTAKELAAKLRPGEAYMSMYSGYGIGAVFVVTPDGRLNMRKVLTTREATLAMVKLMRASFDAAEVPSVAGQWSGFDIQAAAGLYQTWFGPATQDLDNIKVIHLAPGGGLSSVPWAATLRNVPTSLAAADWTGMSQVIAITPGASSVVLNRTIEGKKANKPFIAFANPQFSKASAVHLPVQKLASRGRALRAGDNAFDYAKVSPLPETLDEANAAARSLGANPAEDVISGAAATRSRVLSEKLDDRRMVAFATHGVLPGEIPRLTKPALAMAYEGAGATDSLLTTDDIITLRLNSEWVLLSACNTGLTESGGGESISGMARAFFAAGAKSVLATQWAVESESAKQLVVNSLVAYGNADGLIGKAQALAQAQRDMASGKNGPLYQHPFFWAAYFVMGEPHR